MAGSGLITIKRRIKSISNTRKITRAMGLVATAKLRKSRDLLAINNKFFTSINPILDDVVENSEEYNLYKNGSGNEKKLFVIITSDGGLSGSFNVNVFNAAVAAIKDKENTLVIPVGQKGSNYLRRFKYNIESEFVGLSDLPNMKEASSIANKIVSMFTQGEIGEVYIVYTKFITSMKQDVIVDKLLPLSDDADENYTYGEYTEFEPDVESLLNNIIPVFIKGKIFNYMINSRCSEQATRMAAMDGATKNANELLEKLKGKYNRLRQSAITQEISEIVGGAEAQK